MKISRIVCINVLSLSLIAGLALQKAVAACSEAVYQISMTKNSKKIVISPDPGLGKKAIAVSKKDINKDGIKDLLVRFSHACGNYGECPHSLFVSCGNGKFQEKHSLEYAVSMKFSRYSTKGWKNLIKTTRNSTGVEKQTLTFDGNIYALK